MANSAAWIPSQGIVERANVTWLAREVGAKDYPALHRWSVENRPNYWQMVLDRLKIHFRQPYQTMLDASSPIRAKWLVGARMNIVDSCFTGGDEATAIIEPDRIWTIAQLRELTARVANGLVRIGIEPGDAVAIIMPMTARAVACYLGIIAAGAAAVSIAESFASDEIRARLQLAGTKLVFTPAEADWAGKKLPLYAKVQAANAPRTVVLDAKENLRNGDLDWNDFLASPTFEPISRDPDHTINILFSSGTTGEPKVIPWDHTTPIKCAADAHFHQDIHPGDVLCWPTSLGWMMGPWLIFASLLNRSAMALFGDAPAGAPFGNFVRDAGVTMLGVVPSLVRNWRQSACMEGIDWTAIRAFSSTGECSNPDDMRYLMQLPGGRPVIEYCGGTEIGGGYITGTVVQPCIPASFSTPALGLDFTIIDGEVFIEGPSIGLSTRLLNKDHDAIYFQNTPTGKSGIPLRRHGDELIDLGDGYWRITGRCDDTMNLGGIKIGCAEIERVLNQVAGIKETAAIAIPASGGGPSQLIVFLVPAVSGEITPDQWKLTLQQAIRQHLNPLFRIADVRILDALPRTISNKVLRRQLRAQCESDSV